MSSIRSKIIQDIEFSALMKDEEIDDGLEVHQWIIAKYKGDRFRIQSIEVSNGRRTFSSETTVHQLYGPLGYDYDHRHKYRATPVALTEEAMRDVFVEYLLAKYLDGS